MVSTDADADADASCLPSGEKGHGVDITIEGLCSKGQVVFYCQCFASERLSPFAQTTK